MLTILGRANSSNVQKVLWCCAELGVAFERKDYGASFGNTRTPEYLALNPTALVPTLIEDEFVLWESNTIVRYLAAKFGGEGIYPAEFRARARAERWMDWQLSAIAPPFPTLFIGLVRTPPERRDHAAIDTARRQLAGAFTLLDAHLANQAYVAGNAFSVGDIALGMYAYRWFELGIEREPLPHLQRWYQRLQERPAFRTYIMIGLS